MKIREVNENKKQFIALLLLADEQENMIDHYLEKGTMYVLEDGNVKAECVVTDENNGILEIKNIYLQKCTAPDKPRTVHFFNFTISQFFKQEFHKRICFLNANIPSLPSPTKSSGVSGIGCFSLKNSVI